MEKIKIAKLELTEGEAQELKRLLDAAVKAWGVDQNVALNAGIFVQKIELLEFN